MRNLLIAKPGMISADTSERLAFSGHSLTPAPLEFDKTEIESSMPARFERVVERFPDRTAIRSGGASLAYGELNARANRLAQAILEKRGSGSEAVSFLLGNPESQIIAMLGILKAGKMYLPLDRTYPLDRLCLMQADSQSPLIITDNSQRSLAGRLGGKTSSIIDLDEIDAGREAENPGIAIAPDCPVYILYTSGSAGQPKGVVQNHRNLLHSIRAASRNYRIQPEDRFGLLTSTSFAASNGPIYGSLLNGATVVPYNMSEGIADLAHWIEMEGITLLLMVPSVFRHLALSMTGEEDFSRLRLIVLMGEPLTRSHLDLFKRHFPKTCQLRNSYAATEMHTACSLTLDHQAQFDGNQIPAGRPVGDKEILILDDLGVPVEPGQVGEIVVRSRYLSPGYWRRPDLTQAKFQEDPGEGDQRLFFTGDMGRIDSEDRLILVGRKDFLSKIRGYRVELGEIEGALNQHPAIRECAVIVQETNGQDKRPMAFFVPFSRAAYPSGEELRIFLRRSLPDYMIPFAFVMLDELPFTPSGKIDRRALPSLEQVFNLERDYVPPGDEIERQLASLWEELLEIEPIGIRNDFFRIGGHSLLAASMISRVEGMFGRRLDLSTLSGASTIEHLAAVLRQERGESRPTCLVPLRACGSHPPLYCVHGIGGHILPFLQLAELLPEEQPVYGLQAGPVEPGVSRTIEGMAREYIEEIQLKQPEGPYYLAGYSFGGFVAYEMACQLAEMGQPLNLLAILDTRASGVVGFERNLAPAGRLRYRARAVWAKIRDELIDAIGSRARDSEPAVKETIGEQEAIFGDVAETEIPEHFAQIIEENRAALARFVPKKYPGKVTLFKSAHHGRGSYYGWQELAGGGVEIFEVPATHRSILQQPAVSVLARQLTMCMDQSFKAQG